MPREIIPGGKGMSHRVKADALNLYVSRSGLEAAPRDVAMAERLARLCGEHGLLVL